MCVCCVKREPLALQDGVGGESLRNGFFMRKPSLMFSATVIREIAKDTMN